MSAPMGKGKYPKGLDAFSQEIYEYMEGGGEYWHNLVGFRLSAVAKEFGKEWANRLIVDMGLDNLGWKVVE